MLKCRIAAAVGVCAALLVGCQSARIDEQSATPIKLQDNHQAVALLRVTSPAAACTTATAMIGQRDGTEYSAVKTFKVSGQTPLLVAELLLPPGEYHVVMFACERGHTRLQLAELAGVNRFSRSFATFTLAAGEVVNLGELKVDLASHAKKRLPSHAHVDLSVTDWPLKVVEDFKALRPQLFQSMRVRLMTLDKTAVITPETAAAACAEFKLLQADGKVQNVPAACLISQH